MRNKSALILAATALLLTAGLSAGLRAAQRAGAPPPSRFQVRTSAYSEGSMIPAQYTAAASNPVTAPYSWTDPPAGTMSFAVILHDTDAAPGKNTTDVTHWIFWNIPGTATSIPGDIKPDTSPEGIVQGKNVRGVNGYQPPAPPPGATPHHYVFELYALDVPKLDLPAGSTRDQLLMAMNGHVIGKATYVGIFGR